MSKRTKESKKRINSLVLLIAFTAILLIASTYAWFSTQKNVSINNLRGKVEVAEGLQISLDAENWAQEVLLGTAQRSTDSPLTVTSDWNAYDKGIGTVTVDSKTYQSHNARPIMDDSAGHNISGTTDSSTGFLQAYSSSGQSALNRVFISDSRTIVPFYTGEYTGTKLSKIKQIATDSLGEVDKGYYAFDIYLMNTSKATVTEDQLQLNFNSMVEEIKNDKDSKDFGLKNAVRVAFALYNKDAESGDSKETIVKKTCANDSYIKQVAIWEPNYDQHSTEVMKQNEKLRTLAQNKSTDSAAIETYAVKTNTVTNGIINDVYLTSGETNIDKVNYINRTSGQIVGTDKGKFYTSNTTSTNVTGPTKLNGATVTANNTGVKDLKDTKENPVKLRANSVSKIRVYVWLEGQDPDCINWATQSDGINVNIGLCKGSYEKTTSELE